MNSLFWEIVECVRLASGEDEFDDDLIEEFGVIFEELCGEPPY